MKTIVCTDAVAAQLVADGKAEYASGNEHIEPAPAAHLVAALPPVVQRNENGVRVDGQAPHGTPDTVTLSATGHVLSLPHPEQGEMFPGYCQRVWRQAGGDAGIIGALFGGTEPYFARFGGFKADGSNWPQAADFFFDTMKGGTAYLTDAERNAPKGTQTFEDVGKRIAEQAQQQPAAAPVQQPAAETPVEIPIEPSQQ